MNYFKQLLSFPSNMLWVKLHIGITYKGVTQRCRHKIQMFVPIKKEVLYLNIFNCVINFLCTKKQELI